ncbi:UBC-like protein [Neurospora crassa]|uniref:Ubiquitin-conjugating enzyme E2 6 n=2 Tax=Neurospora crassa TaxID=5141 RepID=Q7S7C4_NEUCR|nr:ubiquitin-conjugating enzyme E2 6 [Neurospora crassa OR74A]EAA31510.2 ubiquitin-conjugating enzyme E2 6 [Neurospora crassa OR74A]KHE82543.1 UBC-like protein [Neurospora crassa]CAE76125.1 related to non-canonical ubiquitin conjugating enzyme 1 [Neurospora crassa]|eukprot:XP_960746.2 ubiquitin-conjugating enzyme E2 6 [Neurospora crassa OR74A]
MATPKFNSKSPTIRRILREAQEISASPSPDYTATPLESDLFEWHFTLRGPPNSVYADGIYHGRIVLPQAYPLRPPSFRFVTPSGRFEANREICLSISGHHEETWQPAWGVRTSLVALRSFMETDPKGQLGGLDATEAVRRRMATESRAWKCQACGKTNEEIIWECEEAAKEHQGEGQAEVEVPSDLKMGWRDEMDKNSSGAVAASRSGAQQDEEDAESAELAEGFVQTVPLPPAPQPRSVGVTSSSSTPAQPGQGVPQPTRTIPLPSQFNPHPPPMMQHRRPQQVRVSNDEVTFWIDRLIVVLSIALAAMILKVFLA